MPSRTRKLLLTALAVGGTATLAGAGVFAAFTATTDNTGNSIASGTVNIDQNGASGAIFTVLNGGPGSSTQRCIRIRYLGTLGATVKMYRKDAVTNGALFNLQVERGSGLTGTFPSCTGFTPAATLYNGALGSFPNSYATASDAKGSAWAQNDAVDYRVTVTVVDDPTPNAHQTSVGTGMHTYTWEARNN